MTDEIAGNRAGQTASEGYMPGAGFGGGYYRIAYRVEEPFQSTGHGDLIRVLYAGIERAELPVAVSGGKASRPKIAFGPPLPAGCTSDREYFDIELEAGADDLVERFNAALPAGLTVLSADRIGLNAAKLSSLIEWAEYAMAIPADVMPSDSVEGRLGRFAGERIWQVQRVSPKGKERTIDLKRAIIRWSHEINGAGCVVTMTMKLNSPDGHNANPSLILSGLFRIPEESVPLVRVRRIAFYAANGRPLTGMQWPRKRNRSLHSKSLQHLRYLDT